MLLLKFVGRIGKPEGAVRWRGSERWQGPDDLSIKSCICLLDTLTRALGRLPGYLCPGVEHELCSRAPAPMKKDTHPRP